MPENEQFIEGVKKEKIQERIQYYSDILNSEKFTKESDEYTQAQDVIEEIIDLLRTSEEQYSFVSSVEIEKRIEEYFKQLESIDKKYLTSKQEKIEGQLKSEEEPEKSGSSSVASTKSLEELLEEIDRLSALDVEPPTPEELKHWKSSQVKTKEENTTELEQIKQFLKELDEREEDDVELQRRVTKNRIRELQSINKEKELFKINEKGEVTIEYPEISYDIDKEAIKSEYESRRQDMLDKFYGNKTKAKMYSEMMKDLQDNIEDVEFEFIDKDGNTQKGVYKTVKDYVGRTSDLSFMQLEEYVERLERLTKAQAGDESVYADVHIRNQEGKFVKLSPEEARLQDELYLENNNNAYNRLALTRKNLMTLGKYGEKVPYNKFQEGQPVRNTLRAVGNAAKFVRNHVTAPINKFVGSKVVSPIYAKVTGADDPSKVAGLYSNKLTHRYVARREYFESQGKGYFSSRFNSIFKAKEGNKAVLAAGAYDIQQSLKRKYTEEAAKEAMKKKIEFASKTVEEKIEMLKADIEKTTDASDIEKLKATLADTEKAQVQIERDRSLNERTATAQTIQTDAVDISQHDIANKENVTRTITGVKVLSRLGIRKLVGPKIKEWLLEHTQKPATVIEPPTQEQIEDALNVPDQKWVNSTYRTEEIPITEVRLKSNADMSEIMSANAGKQIEGYYSVYGGEARPAMYNVTGNEKITAIFEQVGEGGHGLSDTAGLKAPVLTNGTFAQEFLDANGVLKQDVTLEQILGAMGNNSIKPEDLESLYVSVGDRYWTKLSDLCSQMTQEVTVGTDMQQVLDVAGHYVPLTDEEKLQFINKALLDPATRMKIDSLKKVSTTMVENTRVTRVLDGLGIAYNGIDGALLADDVYENVRNTDTDLYWEKPAERHYEAKTHLTGDRKTDMAQTKENRKKESNSREER